MRFRCGTFLAVVFLAAQPLALRAAPLWLAVTHTTKRTGASFYPEIVKTKAEQATFKSEQPNEAKRPPVLRTRRLQFECRGAAYDVPDPFVEDLAWLGADSSVRASLRNKDAVFTMIGDSGPKAYTVHFHFRGGRFIQRILDDGESHTIIVRSYDAL